MADTAPKTDTNQNGQSGSQGVGAASIHPHAESSSRRTLAAQELLCAVCLFFLDEPLFDSVPGHIEAVKRVLPDLRREQIPLRPVSSVFDPNIARKLESIAPPRPPIPPLQGAATWDARRSSGS